jgi:hypothetical protein
MGLFSDLFGGSSNSSSSTTSTSDNRVGASDQAVVSQGQSNQTGGTQLRVSSGGHLDIQNTDADVVAAALKTVEDVVRNQSDLQANVATAGQNALSAANQSIADLAQTKSTGGDSNAQRTIVIALIIFGALGAAFFFFTRKH